MVKLANWATHDYKLRGEINKRTGKITRSIIAILAISLFALGMSILPTGVYAQGGGYNRGYSDALCDAALCHGHGYDPRCPGDHSSEYCNNYRDGYAAGWAATNANSNGQQQPSPPPPFSQGPNQGQGQGQSQGSTNNNNNNPSTNNNNNNPSPNYNNNNPTVIIVPPK